MGRAIRALFVCAACGRSAAPASEPPPPPPPTEVAHGPGTVTEARFTSEALGVDKRVVVYLPGGYDADPARRYPVVYMLHGLGGNEDNWIRGGKLAEAADAIGLQAIVIMPDGDTGFYVDWERPVSKADCDAIPRFSDEPAETRCVEHQRYATYVTRDLIGWVDRTYRTIPERGARGIGGLSMGGYGALVLGMQHPELFASVASHSGVDSILYAGPHPYQKGAAIIADQVDTSKWGFIGPLVDLIFGAELATWRAHDPPSLVATLPAQRPAFYLDCGTEDEFQLEDGAQYLHDVLLDAGIEHEWYLGPGGHDMRFWSERIDDSLRFHAAHLAKAR